MEYYIISLFISLAIFIFVYLCDYKKPMNENENNIIYDNNGYEIPNNNKSLFSKNNLLLFGIIYIVVTIISFYVFTSSISISSLCPLFISNLLKVPEQQPILIKGGEDNDEIDPAILNKINDNIEIGFNPPNMDDDNIDNNNNTDNNKNV
jgi:hypothetical protein